MVDNCKWEIVGEPSFVTEVKPLHTVTFCCATAVNRIPTLLAARPGYVPTNEMPNIL